jgi:chemotaxis protein CheD
MNAHSTRRPVFAALPGFEHITRIWDSSHNIWLAKIDQGEVCVTAPSEGVTTVLGSCVSACIRDTRTGVGGMNHFMLPPDTEHGSVDRDRHGVETMERLIGAVLAHGCGERSRLELKLVGGSRLTPETQAIGQRAIEFVRQFAASARLTIVGEDVGGLQGREVVYWPGTGQLRIRKLRGIQTLVAEREREYGLSLQGASAGDIEGRVG